MARPQAPDFDQRREAILGCAAQLFASHGYNGTSISDIASQCGISKSLIYHYYKSKQQILYKAMDSHLDLLLDGALAYDGEDAGSAEERLRQLTHTFLSAYVGAESRHKVLLNELPSLPPRLKSNIVRKQRRIIAVVENIIIELRPTKTNVARTVAMLYFGMINWSHTWFKPRGPMNTAELADLVVDLILNNTATVRH